MCFSFLFYRLFFFNIYVDLEEFLVALVHCALGLSLNVHFYLRFQILPFFISDHFEFLFETLVGIRVARYFCLCPMYELLSVP